MKLCVKILALISQTIVLILLFIDKNPKLDYSNIQWIILVLNGASIALLLAPDKFNEAYQEGYQKIKTIDYEKDTIDTETLGWKGALYLWIVSTIGSLLVGVFLYNGFHIFL